MPILKYLYLQVGHVGGLWEYKGIHGVFVWGKKQGSSLILNFAILTL